MKPAGFNDLVPRARPSFQMQLGRGLLETDLSRALIQERSLFKPLRELNLMNPTKTVFINHGYSLEATDAADALALGMRVAPKDDSYRGPNFHPNLAKEYGGSRGTSTTLMCVQTGVLQANVYANIVDRAFSATAESAYGYALAAARELPTIVLVDEQARHSSEARGFLSIVDTADIFLFSEPQDVWQRFVGAYNPWIESSRRQTHLAKAQRRLGVPSTFR